MKTIPPFRLIAEPMTAEAQRLHGFKWAADEVGKRHQLGGRPTPPIDDERWPRCPDCQERMTFYGQLDSVSDEFCVADAGLVCVFVCFECNEVKGLIESP